MQQAPTPFSNRFFLGVSLLFSAILSGAFFFSSAAGREPVPTLDQFLDPQKPVITFEKNTSTIKNAPQLIFKPSVAYVMHTTTAPLSFVNKSGQPLLIQFDHSATSGQVVPLAGDSEHKLSLTPGLPLKKPLAYCNKAAYFEFGAFGPVHKTGFTTPCTSLSVPRGTFQLLSERDYKRMLAQAKDVRKIAQKSPEKKAQSLKPLLFSANLGATSEGRSITTLELGMPVTLQWEIMPFAGSAGGSCTLLSDGDADNALNYGIAIGRELFSASRTVNPIRPMTTYSIRCASTTSKNVVTVAKLPLSVTRTAGPILNELRIFPYAEAKQLLTFYYTSDSKVTVDCPGNNRASESKERSFHGFPAPYYYTERDVFIRPVVSGLCTVRVEKSVKGKKVVINKSIEVEVRDTSTPPLELKVRYQPSKQPIQAEPGELKTITFDLAGLTTLSDNTYSIKDVLRGENSLDTSCIKNFQRISITDIPNDPLYKRVVLAFRPTKSMNCRYVLSSKRTGQEETITFSFKVIPPRIPIIRDVLVNHPYGQEAGADQYLEFTTVGEAWEVTGPKGCTDGRNGGVSPNHPGLFTNTFSDVSFVTWVWYPITSKKSVECVITAKNTNGAKVTQKVTIPYRAPADPIPAVQSDGCVSKPLTDTCHLATFMEGTGGILSWLTSGGSLANNTQPIANNTWPLVNNADPLVNNGQPLANNTSPIANNTSPLVNNGQPLVNNADPLANNTSPLNNANPFANNTSPVTNSSP